MECILWNKKKTPDYKYTFLGEEPILFVGELFNNSNCLITDANNDNKPVEDYEYGKVQKTDSIAFVEIYQQKYAVGRINISNCVYDNGSKCNVYYNEKLLNPNTINRIPSSIKPELLKITITKLFNNDNIYINYPIDNVEYNITNNRLIIKTKTGIYLGANGEEGYKIEPLDEIEIPTLKTTEAVVYTGDDYWNEVLPTLSDNRISCTVTNSSGVSITNMIDADTYTITYSLVDENTAWTNGTTSPIRYKYIIKKRKFELFCYEETGFTLNSNSTITTKIGIIEGPDFPIIPVFTIEYNYSKDILKVEQQEGQPYIDFKANDISYTDTAHVYISLNMANYESSNKLDFNITLELFNWTNATWADLKELCKKGNLENNSGLVLGASKNIINDLNAILIYKNQNTMVFALPILNTIDSSVFGGEITYTWSNSAYSGNYQESWINRGCNNLRTYLSENGQNNFISILKNTNIPYYKQETRSSIILSSLNNKFFAFSGKDLGTQDSAPTLESSSLLDTNLIEANQIKELIYPNIDTTLYSFWLRDASSIDPYREVTAVSMKNNNPILNSESVLNEKNILLGFIIDGEEETANG